MSGHLFPTDNTENWMNMDTVQDFLSPQKPLKCIQNIQSIFQNRKFSLQKSKDKSNQIKDDLTAKINFCEYKTPKNMIMFKCINHPNKKVFFIFQAKYYEINTNTNGRNIYCSSCAVKLSKQGRKLFELELEEENKENIDPTQPNQFQTPNMKKIQSNIAFGQRDQQYGLQTPRKKNESSHMKSSLSISSFQFEDNQVELLSGQLDLAQTKVADMLAKVSDRQELVTKIIDEQKDQVKSQFQGFIDKILASRDEALQKIDDQFASNITILNKIDKKTKIYKHNILNMKKELNQRQENFFIDDEELEPIIENYKSKIEQIQKYNQNVENMTLLIDKICQNSKTNYQISQDFQLVQKSKIFSNNSHRTPVTDKKKKEFSQSIMQFSKKQLVFKPIQQTIQKQRQSYLTPQTKF